MIRDDYQYCSGYADGVDYALEAMLPLAELASEYQTLTAKKINEVLAQFVVLEDEYIVGLIQRIQCEDKTSCGH